MMDTLAVYAVVLLHYVVTFIPPLGGFAVLRHRRLLWIHLPILVWALSIPFVQYPCPLTDLEKSLRVEAGMPVYSTHFLEHYIFQPLGTQGSMLWTIFNTAAIAVPYTLIVSGRRRRDPEPQPRQTPSSEVV